MLLGNFARALYLYRERLDTTHSHPENNSDSLDLSVLHKFCCKLLNYSFLDRSFVRVEREREGEREVG